MVSLYFIGGIIIALLDIIGVYLGKTFGHVKRWPLNIIAAATEAVSAVRDPDLSRATWRRCR